LGPPVGRAAAGIAAAGGAAGRPVGMATEARAVAGPDGAVPEEGFEGVGPTGF
jgi:hypothetical protein